MSKNYIAPGDVLDVLAPADRTSGQGVLIGTQFGVALHTALSGAALRIGVAGVFELAADNNLVISVGDRVFWDPANNWVDKTLAAQQCVGRAVTAKGTTGTTVHVKLGDALPVGT